MIDKRYKFFTKIDEEKENINLAYDSKQNLTVVIKSFNSRKNYFSELNILRSLGGHKNIIRLLDVYIENNLYSDNYNLVFEYAENGDLLDFILSNQKLDYEKIFKEIILSVHWCHSNYVAHRDIKPANILVKNNGTIALCDFGLACYTHKNKNSNVFCGTPTFMSPQVADSRYGKYYDLEKSDIWSCGVVLYVIVFKKLPFDGDNELNILEAVKFNPLKFDGLVDTKIKKIISYLLRRDELSRPTARQVLSYV